MRHRSLTATTVTVLILLARSVAGEPGQTTAERADAEFARKVAQDHVAEIEFCKLATTKATRSDIKRFAQRLVDDHRSAYNQLLGLARADTWSLSTSLSMENRKLYERMAGLDGEKFDRTYLVEQVRIHEHTIDFFEGRTNTISDTDLWQWSMKTLTANRDHLHMARELQAK